MGGKVGVWGRRGGWGRLFFERGEGAVGMRSRACVYDLLVMPFVFFLEEGGWVGSGCGGRGGSEELFCFLFSFRRRTCYSIEDLGPATPQVKFQWGFILFFSFSFCTAFRTPDSELILLKVDSATCLYFFRHTYTNSFFSLLSFLFSFFFHNLILILYSILAPP